MYGMLTNASALLGVGRRARDQLQWLLSRRFLAWSPCALTHQDTAENPFRGFGAKVLAEMPYELG